MDAQNYKNLEPKVFYLQKEPQLKVKIDIWREAP